MSPQQATEKIEDVVINSSDKFIEGVEKTQTAILGKLNSKIRGLELYKDGTIKPNTANLKLLRSIKSDLTETIVNPAYRKKLSEYIKSFETLKGINDTYFAVMVASFTPTKALYSEILKSAIEVTENSLLDAGISANVITPINDILTQNITTGALITDLEKTLKLYIVGDEKRLGVLKRYVTQITRDALNQYSANYTQAISFDLDLKWYYYSAGKKTNTRSYCASREGKYFSIEQIKNVPENWSGRIPGTNSSNILTYRGGFNCMHQYYPVLEESVPDEFR